MSKTPRKPDKWDAATEAANAFKLIEDVKAVIFWSDAAVIKKARKGPTKRRLEKLWQKLTEHLATGCLDEARDETNRTTWPDSKEIWWTTSTQELTDLINEHDQIIKTRRITVGISVEEIAEHVILFRMWVDGRV